MSPIFRGVEERSRPLPVSSAVYDRTMRVRRHPAPRLTIGSAACSHRQRGGAGDGALAGPNAEVVELTGEVCEVRAS